MAGCALQAKADRNKVRRVNHPSRRLLLTKIPVMDIFQCCLVAWLSYFLCCILAPHSPALIIRHELITNRRASLFAFLGTVVLYAAYILETGTSFHSDGFAFVLITSVVWLGIFASIDGYLAGMDHLIKKSTRNLVIKFIIGSLRKLSFTVAVTYTALILLVNGFNWLARHTATGLNASRFLQWLTYWQKLCDYLTTGSRWLEMLMIASILILVMVKIFRLRQKFREENGGPKDLPEQRLTAAGALKPIQQASRVFASKGFYKSHQRIASFLGINAAALFLLALLGMQAKQAWPGLRNNQLLLKYVVFKEETLKLDQKWAEKFSTSQPGMLEAGNQQFVDQYSRYLEIQFIKSFNVSDHLPADNYLNSSAANAYDSTDALFGRLRYNLIYNYQAEQAKTNPETIFGKEIAADLKSIIGREDPALKGSTLRSISQTLRSFKNSFTTSVSTDDILDLAIDKILEKPEDLVTLRVLQSLQPIPEFADKLKDQVNFYADNGISAKFKAYLKVRARAFITEFTKTNSLAKAIAGTIHSQKFTTDDAFLFTSGAYQAATAQINEVVAELSYSKGYQHLAVKEINENPHQRVIEMETFRVKAQQEQENFERAFQEEKIRETNTEHFMEREIIP